MKILVLQSPVNSYYFISEYKNSSDNFPLPVISKSFEFIM